MMKGEKKIILKCGPWRKTIEEEEEDKRRQNMRDTPAANSIPCCLPLADAQRRGRRGRCLVLR